MDPHTDLQPEPWLRGTLTDVDPVRRAVLHALQLTAEDATRWCGTLTEAQLAARPSGLPPLAFQFRHIARSLDRLLTYAEGRPLTASQLEALASEADPRPGGFDELQAAVTYAVQRVLAIAPDTFAEPRTVGRKHLPTTVAGLLIHCAEHTQRHTGQLVTTARIVLANAPS